MIKQQVAPALRTITAFFISLMLAFSLLPLTANADEAGPIAKAQSGGCIWEISAAGKLTIYPATGTSGNLGSIGNVPDWYPNASSVTSVEIRSGVIAGASIQNMFRSMSNLKTADLTGLDTKNVTNMSNLFTGCSSLSDITGLNFNTSNVTNMSSMFDGCKSLTALTLAGFNTSKVTNMNSMFADCEKLTSIDLSSFDTSSATNMASMFFDCSSLDFLELSNFNTSKATSIHNMFSGCSSLRRVHVGKTFSFKGVGGSSSDRCLLPEGNWLSQSYNKIFTATEITENRNNLEDLYIKDGEVNPDAIGTTTHKVIYRLYNKNSGEHLYTNDSNEKTELVKLGWNDEGIGWYAPDEGTNVYRLYNPYSGDHHYTPDANERDVLTNIGWQYEGIAWLSATDEATPLYRLYNPYEKQYNHHWTTDKNERDTLVKLGWRDEGIGWYGVA